MNATWPVHYPSAQCEPADRPASRPGLPHSYSAIDGLPGPLTASSSLPLPLRRSVASFSEIGEPSRAAEKQPADAPRLLTPQIAQEFSILKLDLRLGAQYQTELVHALGRDSIASLLDGKISASIRHLLALRERIEDTSSKVLVTGDLNAGKSTFCNALLRRKILPEDQQPCTAIFCEVLDARENSGLEDVHAVHKDRTYDRHKGTTYDVFTLQELEKIVTDNTKYMQCKVYIKDVRTIDESLLNNGVVDIALIDAPGLNHDTTKTTAIFARQQEIDIIVFVVSAANHFTISAQDFISAAAAEKAYLFIVVNGFDVIKDKERCERMILEQVYGLSPRTFKESSDLVHFVSSNAIPMALPPPGNPSRSRSASGGDSGDPSDDPKGKGKGKDVEKIRDFERLEQALRRFVLDKRARPKLAPAKNYLLNILNDMNNLAMVNAEVAQSELNRMSKTLEEITPQLESSTKAKNEVGNEIDKTIEETCREVYDYSRSTLSSAIAHAGDGSQLYDVAYPGLLGVFRYAEELKEAMLARIADSVTACEESARMRTFTGVNTIKQLGILHLGNDYENLIFRPDVMFRRKRDALARQVNIPIKLWDFVDWSVLVPTEKVAGTGMAFTVATAVGGRVMGLHTWMDQVLMAARLMRNDNLPRLVIPSVAVTGTCFFPIVYS